MKRGPVPWYRQFSNVFGSTPAYGAASLVLSSLCITLLLPGSEVRREQDGLSREVRILSDGKAGKYLPDLLAYLSAPAAFASRR